MKKQLFLLTFLPFVFGCNENSDESSGKELLVTPALTVTENFEPFSGFLEIYPCNYQTLDYYGNYYGNPPQRFVLSAAYWVKEGTVTGVSRPIRLPFGRYTMLSWGIYQSSSFPSYPTPASRLPPITAGLNFQDAVVKSVKLARDTTYYPMHDYGISKQEYEGVGRFSVVLKRVVAGLTVTIERSDGRKFTSSLQEVRVLIGNIAAQASFVTGTPQDQTKTVSYSLTVAPDSLQASNLPVMVFPSAPHPPLQLVFLFKDGSVRTYQTILRNTLSANTLLAVDVAINSLTSEVDPHGITVDNLTETQHASSVDFFQNGRRR